ncbi:hypothetical protein CC78DRAFT_578787 [Lojkania enalia]|uniref:Uncharacterized protein n=1 Tax=Lojkania enalia TaxID=147567 RepID=A0A9P4KC20_9PLEO|nr:hypothetical protein CC78DRAFT_578787 [Didymosphaeria enalia]
MSTSGPRYHIPFPTNYLALNTRPSKPTPSADVTSPESEVPSHNFLSNRPAVPRHSSISSNSSDSSTSTMPESPTSNTFDASPVIKQSVPTFLALNSKYAAPPAKPTPVVQSAFLSNRH